MTATPVLLLALLFGAVSALPPVSVDSSLPAMAAMAAGLGVGEGAVQVNLACYMVGSAFGQLVIGPLSDRTGRRPVLIAGLCLYIAASAGCAFAPNLETLLLLRFVQGLGTATGRVLPRAMIRDLFEREQAAKLLSYMMVVGGASPIFAPLIGGTLTEWAGWSAVFGFMTVYAVLVLALVVWKLQETLPPEARQRPSLGRIAANYLMIARHRTVGSYLLCMVFCNVGLFAFLTASSAVLIGALGQTPRQFATQFAIVMIAFAGTNFVGGRIVHRTGIDRLVATGAAIAAAAGLAIALVTLAGALTVWALVGLMFVFMIGYSLVLPQATAGALTPFPQLAGTASAMLGFLQFCAGGLTAIALGLLHDGTAVPLAVTLGLAGPGALLTWLLLIRPLARGQSRV